MLLEPTFVLPSFAAQLAAYHDGKPLYPYGFLPDGRIRLRPVSHRVRPDSIRARICSEIAEQGKVSRWELVRLIGKDKERKVDLTLAALCASGQIERCGRALYRMGAG